MAAQLGMKGPPPSGEQPVDKMFNSQLIKVFKFIEILYKVN